MKQQPQSRPAVKANRIRPFISGFHGQHSMEVAIAYWHRGHYLYGHTRNPIEPLQFVTQNQAMIVGTAAGTAPIYEVSQSNHSTATVDSVRGRVYEYQVGALRKSMEYEWKKTVLADMENTRAKNEGSLGVGNQVEKIINRPTNIGNPFKVIPPATKLPHSRVLAPSPMLSKLSPPSLVIEYTDSTTYIEKPYNLKNIKAPSNIYPHSIYRIHTTNSPADLSPSYAATRGADTPSAAQTAIARITQPAYARILDRYFSPNDHSGFSANTPGSQAYAPLGSRHISPVSMSFPDGGAPKYVASTSRLRRLLAEEGIKRKKYSIPLETLIDEGLKRAQSVRGLNSGKVPTGYKSR
jgi:hypothetical protein